MKVNSHDVIYLILAGIAVALAILLSEGEMEMTTLHIVSWIFAVGFTIALFRKIKSNRSNGSLKPETQKSNTYSPAHYNFEGIFRKGELRVVSEYLIFESNGLDDYGPNYKFPFTEITSFRFEDIQFSGDSKLILTMRSGKEEEFRMGSSGYWTAAFVELGLPEGG